jgi:uncharacterized protein
VLLLRQGEPESSFPPEAETLTFGQAPVALSELIEDELLLAMPMVPMHSLNECPAQRFVTGGAEGDAPKNPFEKLARSKRDRN